MITIRKRESNPKQSEYVGKMDYPCILTPYGKALYHIRPTPKINPSQLATKPPKNFCFLKEVTIKTHNKNE
jgi:hypothetical protein